MQPGLKKGVEKSSDSVWKSWAQRYSHPVPSLFLNICFILVSWKTGFLCVSVHVIGARGCPQLPTHLCRRPAHADVGSISPSDSIRFQQDSKSDSWRLNEVSTICLINYVQGTRTVKYKLSEDHSWEWQVNLNGHSEWKGLYCVCQIWRLKRWVQHSPCLQVALS